MEMKFPIVFISILLLASCSDPITRTLAEENARPEREIKNWATEMALREKRNASGENSLVTAVASLRPQTDAETRTNLMQRLADVQSGNKKWTIAMANFHKQRLPGDRIFYVHSLSEAATYYVLIRNNRVIARTERSWWVE